jgi:hypothetical protein
MTGVDAGSVSDGVIFGRNLDWMSGNTVCGEDMTRRMGRAGPGPARPTHDLTTNLNLSERLRTVGGLRTDSIGPWTQGEAARLVKQVLKTKPVQ